MGTYWESFMKDYENQLSHVCTSDMLKAFWFYCNNDRVKSDDIMNNR